MANVFHTPYVSIMVGLFANNILVEKQMKYFALFLVFLISMNGCNYVENRYYIIKNAGIYHDLGSDSDVRRMRGYNNLMTMLDEYIKEPRKESMVLIEDLSEYVIKGIYDDNVDIRTLAISLMDKYIMYSGTIISRIIYQISCGDRSYRKYYIELLAKSDKSLFSPYDQHKILMDYAIESINSELSEYCIEMAGRYRLDPEYCVPVIIEIYYSVQEESKRKKIIDALADYGADITEEGRAFMRKVNGNGK